MKLLNVPNNQIQWFVNNNYDLKVIVYSTELITYQMLENNIIGFNDRFINWTSDYNGLIDDFFENYILQKERTSHIILYLFRLMKKAEYKEYFEIAHNINTIIKAVDEQIINYQNQY